MTVSRLMAELDGARIVHYDSNADVILAWFGGHGVYAYDAAGQEIAFWNVGSFADNNASESDVLESMGERMRDCDYADFG